jgi:2-dehydro-3-deoxyphosphogluconate aldolase/(4S)-4-hydroxy-2-oxoglutarate aldolase
MSDKVLQELIDGGVIPVVRVKSADQLEDIFTALLAGGLKAIEVTMTTPRAIEVIGDVSRRMGDDVLVGVGTVLDTETARAAILAGAEFVVCPTLNLEVIRLCQRYDKVICPGAFTPTEILAAWETGADIVKVFPATALGPSYFKDVKGPLPQVRLMPTGGVNLENAGDFIKNGASAIAVGGNLINSKWVAAGEFDKITEAAIAFRKAVADARSG